MSWRDLPPTVRLDASPRAARTLLIILEGACDRRTLPESGVLRVGRAAECDVAIDDPSISREHLLIHVGEELFVEDLGSANGTLLSGERIAAREKRLCGPGHVIELGNAMLMIRAIATAPRRARRLLAHAHFEARLEEACERSAGQLAVMRIHLDRDPPRDAISEAFDEALAPSDVAASYAEREYEALLFGADRARAELIASRLQSALEDEGVALRAGIAVSPEDGTTADALIERACAALRRSVQHADSGLVIADEAMRDLYRLIERVAIGRISVLLLGETGAGKEVLAEAVHAASPRKDHRFVRLNCAAISESLFEAEMFGHEKGAFTGAEQARTGLLEQADGGTVFLDELGELPLALQAKLLRAIDQRQIIRVGGREPRSIDVRFVSATNRDLEAEVARGSFREDLFYRLSGVTLVIPPLRERPSEIEPLAKMFLARASSELGRAAVPQLSAEARELLRAYAWPGNLRELRNVIERALLLATSTTIEPRHLPLDKFLAGSSARADEDERERTFRVLEEQQWNQTKAAAELGISRRGLSKRLNRYGVAKPRPR